MNNNSVLSRFEFRSVDGQFKLVTMVQRWPKLKGSASYRLIARWQGSSIIGSCMKEIDHLDGRWSTMDNISPG